MPLSPDNQCYSLYQSVIGMVWLIGVYTSVNIYIYFFFTAIGFKFYCCKFLHCSPRQLYQQAFMSKGQFLVCCDKFYCYIRSLSVTECHIHKKTHKSLLNYRKRYRRAIFLAQSDVGKIPPLQQRLSIFSSWFFYINCCFIKSFIQWQYVYSKDGHCSVQ